MDSIDLEVFMVSLLRAGSQHFKMVWVLIFTSFYCCWSWRKVAHDS